MSKSPSPVLDSCPACLKLYTAIFSYWLYDHLDVWGSERLGTYPTLFLLLGTWEEYSCQPLQHLVWDQMNER